MQRNGTKAPKKSKSWLNPYLSYDIAEKKLFPFSMVSMSDLTSRCPPIPAKCASRRAPRADYPSSMHP